VSVLGLGVSVKLGVRARTRLRVMARVRHTWGTKPLDTKTLGYEMSGSRLPALPVIRHLNVLPLCVSPLDVPHEHLLTILVYG